MTVPYRAFYYVLPANKCAVGRDALILPRRNLADCNKRCKPFVGDDAWAIPHNSKCRAAAAGAVLKPQGGNCAVLPLHRPACRALSNPPTSNSVARLNFHHHKKHMPAHSAPGICFFCYRTINLFSLRHRIIILHQQIHAGPIAFHAQGLVIPAQKTGIHRAACLFDRAFPLGPIGVVVG